MKPPTTISQIKTINELKTYLGMFTKLVPTHEFVLKYGRPYLMNKHSISKFPKGIPKQCYMNAFHLMESDPDLVYVEGFCSIGIIPIEHAWCINKKGKVVDSTLKISKSKINPCGYFGVPFKKEYIYATALKTKYFGILSFRNPDLLLGKVPVEEFYANSL